MLIANYSFTKPNIRERVRRYIIKDLPETQQGAPSFPTFYDESAKWINLY